jgi:hypothetical protein
MRTSEQAGCCGAKILGGQNLGTFIFLILMHNRQYKAVRVPSQNPPKFFDPLSQAVAHRNIGAEFGFLELDSHLTKVWYHCDNPITTSPLLKQTKTSRHFSLVCLLHVMSILNLC